MFAQKIASGIKPSVARVSLTRSILCRSVINRSTIAARTQTLRPFSSLQQAQVLKSLSVLNSFKKQSQTASSIARLSSVFGVRSFSSSSSNGNQSQQAVIPASTGSGSVAHGSSNLPFAALLACASTLAAMALSEHQKRREEAAIELTAGLQDGVEVKVTPESPTALPDDIMAWIQQTYLYLLGGLTISFVSAVAFLKTGLAAQFLPWAVANPILATVTVLAACFTTLLGTLWTSPENTVQKHIFWTLFQMVEGATLAPLALIYPAMMMAQAALLTLGVTSIFTTISLVSREESVLKWGGVLGALVFVTFVASLVSAFAGPAGGATYAVANNISLYLGLVVFSALITYDTTVMIKVAKVARSHKIAPPADSKDLVVYDPINHSVNIYLDVINVFLRILEILDQMNRK